MAPTQDILSAETNCFFSRGMAGCRALQLAVQWFFHRECRKSVIHVITAIHPWLSSFLTTNMNLLCWCTSFMSHGLTGMSQCARSSVNKPAWNYFFGLCRSGSQRAQLCSTWSVASAWTVKPRWDLQSFYSVAPRWPASPGSHKSLPEPQRMGRGRGRSRFWTQPAEGIGVSRLHTVCRLAEG